MPPAQTNGLPTSATVPRISILIPTYNRGDFLPSAVASALAQSHPADEILVVDDGSTDGTEQLIQPFLKQGVRYIRKEHSGAPATRNHAIEQAIGDYLLWLDSDDVLLESTVALYHEALAQTPKVDVLYGILLIADTNLNVTGQKLAHPDWYGSSREMIAQLLIRNVVPNPGTLVRKACYEQVGMYDLGFPRAHDYEFWVRLAPVGNFRRVERPVVLWRWHDANMSSPTVKFDTRYDIRIVQTLLARYTLEELFPDLAWDEENRLRSLGIANLRLAQRMIQLSSVENAMLYLERSLDAYPLLESRNLLLDLQSGKVGQKQQESDLLRTSESEPPMRILLTAHRCLPESRGGVEIYTDQLARELVSRGHEVHLLVPALSPSHPVGKLSREERDGFTLWQVVTRTELLVDEFQLDELAAPIREVLHTARPELVHCQHLIGLTLTLLHEVKLAGIPVIGTIHDGWFPCHQFHFLEGGIEPCSGPETVDKCVQCLLKRNPDADPDAHLPELFYFFALRRQQMLRAWRSFDRLLVPTEALVKKLKTAGFDHPSMTVHPLGMPGTEVLPHVPGKGRLRIVLPGNVFPTKGQDIAIAALGGLPADRVELHIHGEEVNPTYLKQLKAMIPQGYKVEFHGGYMPSDIPAIFSHADLCLVPSRSENYPLVVRESLRAGVPVVASRIGGIPEIIEDGRNGLLFKVGDARDLAHVLKQILDTPDLLDTLRQRIEPIKSIERDVDELMTLYRALVPLPLAEEVI